MTEALGQITLPRPPHTVGLEYKEQFVVVLENDARLVADEICRKVTAK